MELILITSCDMNTTVWDGETAFKMDRTEDVQMFIDSSKNMESNWMPGMTMEVQFCIMLASIAAAMLKCYWKIRKNSNQQWPSLTKEIIQRFPFDLHTWPICEDSRYVVATWNHWFRLISFEIVLRISYRYFYVLCLFQNTEPDHQLIVKIFHYF